MLELRYFEEDIEILKDHLEKRNTKGQPTDHLLSLSKRRKELIQLVEELKSKRNSVSKEIGQLKALSKKDPDKAKQADEKIKSMKQLGEDIKIRDQELHQVQKEFDDLAMTFPNLLHETTPVGKGEEDNVEIRKWGTPSAFDFETKDHIDLGENLGILDFERASKMSGARFSVYRKAGAALERALIQFMLDVHTKEHGYEEMIPPFLVNQMTMTGTGQLPKFEKDLFRTQVECEDEQHSRSLYLIPTAEVPLTNFYANEILDSKSLPVYFTAYTPCFRSEAGSYGKDTRGLIRLHQFQKVEMVKLTSPETSDEELEKMTQNAEKILQLLNLPYRVVELCSGDIGFGARKTYDLEVWVPSQNKYREISSCSTCGDFQARRAKIRFRPEPQAKPQYVHTLNGSGLAVGRTFVAILENYQTKTGEIKIPRVLRPYLEGKPGFSVEGEDLWIRKSKES